MWRHATAEDAEEFVAMCLALYREDPGTEKATPEGIRRTLDHFRERPDQGQAVVAEVGGRAAGYAPEGGPAYVRLLRERFRPDDVLVEQQKVASAQALAFIAPTYFVGFPAMLKGWTSGSSRSASPSP